jgi:hypothetical protein
MTIAVGPSLAGQPFVIGRRAAGELLSTLLVLIGRMR